MNTATSTRKTHKLVERFDSYTERTPSGQGLRILIHGRKPGDKCRTSKHPNKLFARIEIYSHDRYITVTGRILEGAPSAIATRQSELDALYREMFEERSNDWNNDQSVASKPVEALDEELLEKARSGVNGLDSEPCMIMATSSFSVGITHRPISRL